jgi:hypothetical protein
MVNFSSLIQSLLFLIVILILIKGLPLLLRIIKSKKGSESEFMEEEDEPLPYVRKNIMTPTELKLYGRLVSAFPNHLLFSQVQLSQVIKAPPSEKSLKWFSTISQMSLDFVIGDKSSNPLCVIELDDKTHLRESAKTRDAKKDKALGAAGIPIIRIKVDEMPTVAQLPKLLGITEK